MKRITFLNPIGTIGGAEQVLLLMMRTAIQAEYTVTLILMDDGPLRQVGSSIGAHVIVSQLPSQLSGLGDTQFRNAKSIRSSFAIVWSVAARIPSMLSVLNKLKSDVRKSRPDLLYSNGLKTHLLSGFVRPRGIPVFWHVHDYYSQRPAVKLLLKYASSSQVRAVAISRSVGNDVRAVLPKIQTEVVLNAVDLNRFKPGAAPDNLLETLAGVSWGSQEYLRVGIVATYANWKGHVTFLRAFQKALMVQPNLRGFIIGGPIYKTQGSQVTREELEREAIELGISEKVGFVPFQANTEDIYRSLNIFVHASTRPEPFGLTIAEAMACGRAVVVSSAGGAIELFDEGVSAVGHTPGNVDELADAISKLANDANLRQAIGRNARGHAIEHFHEERFSCEWLNAIG